MSNPSHSSESWNPFNKITDPSRRWDNRFLKIGEILFLLGIAFLIVRKNTYPWPLKRASDILFLLSLICALPQWRKILNIFEKVKTSSILLISGLLISSLYAYISLNIKINQESILSLSRFIEAIVILVLIGFYQGQNKNFYKLVALFQLSTLIYLITLAMPKIHTLMYRFQFLENWPSNIGYYLIPSIIFLLSSFLYKNDKYKKILAYIGCSGLIAIILWSQTRAAWLAIFLSVIILLFIWSNKSPSKFALGLLIVGSMTTSGFFILKPDLQSEVLGRISPELRKGQNIYEKRAVDLILQEGFSPNLYEASRPFLWKEFGKRIIENPLGEGLNYRLIKDQIGDAKGPHNTILEILINGGIISLLGYISLFYLGLKNLLTKKMEIWRAYIFISLLGLVIASQLDNMSTFRLMWILLGLGIFL